MGARLNGAVPEMTLPTGFLLGDLEVAGSCVRVVPSSGSRLVPHSGP
jgi:hypothetical protein